MNIRSNSRSSGSLRPLGELLDFRNEIVHPKDKPTGSAVFVGLEHIEPNTGYRVGQLAIDLADMSGRRASFHKGDIVYGYLRPYLNKVWIAEFDGFCSVDQYVFKVRPGVDRDYVAHFLRSDAFLRTAPVGLSPGQLPRIRSGEIKATEVWLPPLDEQRRIAAILDKADALRRKRKRALDLLDSLTQSIFLEMFGDVTRWNVVCPLAELSDIVSGITKGRKLNGQKVRPIGYLAVSNVQDKRLDLSSVKTIEATETEICRYRLRQDDLLLTEGGDPDKLGRGTLWKGEIDEVIHQNHIFRVRVRSDDLLPLYLMWLVGSAYGKSYFLRSAKQTTGIASINKQQLSSFPVPIPPLRLQKSFADTLGKVRHFLNHAVKAKAFADTLFTSLQSRAFSGQL